MLSGVGPDTPTEVTPEGGLQSAVPFRCDLVDGRAELLKGAILKEGLKTHGLDNWRKISCRSHVNHCLVHLYAWLADDLSDDHLGHAYVRMMMAVAKSPRWQEGVPQEVPPEGLNPPGGQPWTADCPHAELQADEHGTCKRCGLRTKLVDTCPHEEMRTDTQGTCAHCRKQLMPTEWRESPPGSGRCKLFPREAPPKPPEEIPPDKMVLDADSLPPGMIRLHPRRQHIYVAGPYRADTRSQMEVNILRAEQAAQECIERGHSAFCPHTMTQNWEEKLPVETILENDEQFLRRYATAILYLDPSEGADRELAVAKEHRLEIYTNLGDVPDLRTPEQTATGSVSDE